MVGGLLLSATNPESGTVTYTYNGSNHIATKTDANQNQFQYTYDSYNRVTEVQHFVYQYPFGPATEDTTQQVHYYYDTNPYDGGNYSQYTQGRLAAITYQPKANTAVSSTLPTFSEWYSYTQAGQVAGKQLQISQYLSQTSTAKLNLNGSWTYHNEGKTTAVTYPSVTNHSGTYTTGYDTMYRPSTLMDNSSNTWASNVSYGPSNELLTLKSESRTYNSLLQLTQITNGGFSQQYIYPTNGTNNGKAIQQNDLVSGEQVVYAYDSLNRLLSAQTTATSDQTNPAWGQAYVYDGFGNLYQKNVTKGSAPSLSVGVNQTTNQLSESGLGYDANGNALGVYPASQTYDVENRVSSAGQYNIPQVLYAYDPHNRRVWKGTVNGSGVITAQEMYFYGATGKKLGTYVATFGPLNTSYWTASDLQVHFGRRRVAHWASSTNGGTVQFFATILDRVGSMRNAGSANANSSFYPYGEDKGTAAPNDQTKFATFTRDSATGLDYAMNRYYSSTMGRFMTPDPNKASTRTKDPQSWNRYAYTRNDPVDRLDPRGMDDCAADFCVSTISGYEEIPSVWWDDSPSNGDNDFADQRAQSGPTSSAQALLNQLRRAVAGAAAAASDRITSQNCASLFLTSDDNTTQNRAALGQLLADVDLAPNGGLNTDNVNVMTSGTFAASGIPASVPAFVPESGDFLWIVQGGAFFTGTAPNGQPLGGAFAGLPLYQVQQLTLIHEFMHQIGLIGQDSANQTYTLANGQTVTGTAGLSQAIRTNCF